MADLEEIRVTGAELAKFLGIAVQRINQLAAEGTIERTDGTYPLQDSIRAYCSRLREQAAGRSATAPDGSILDPIYEAARLKARQADMLEIKLATARGELLPAGQILAVWQRIISVARSRLLSLSSRLPTQIHGLTKQDMSVIQDEVRTVLEKLAEDGERARDEIRKSALEDGDGDESAS